MEREREKKRERQTERERESNKKMEIYTYVPNLKLKQANKAQSFQTKIARKSNSKKRQSRDHYLK